MNDVYKQLIDTITPLCKTDEEIKGVPVYVRSDKYRKKMIDYIETAKNNKDIITADQLLLLAIKMSNQEKEEGLR